MAFNPVANLKDPLPFGGVTTRGFPPLRVQGSKIPLPQFTSTALQTQWSLPVSPFGYTFIPVKPLPGSSGGGGGAVGSPIDSG